MVCIVTISVLFGNHLHLLYTLTYHLYIIHLINGLHWSYNVYTISREWPLLWKSDVKQYFTTATFVIAQRKMTLHDFPRNLCPIPYDYSGIFTTTMNNNTRPPHNVTIYSWNDTSVTPTPFQNEAFVCPREKIMFLKSHIFRDLLFYVCCLPSVLHKNWHHTLMLLIVGDSVAHPRMLFWSPLIYVFLVIMVIWITSGMIPLKM